MEKMAWGGPKWGWETVFRANPDLADIWGDTILRIFIFEMVFGFPISGFPGPRISKICMA